METIYSCYRVTRNGTTNRSSVEVVRGEGWKQDPARTEEALQAGQRS